MIKGLTVDFLELAQADDFERCLDDTAAIEVKSFCCVLSVPHIRSLDRDHLDDRFEDRSPVKRDRVSQGPPYRTTSGICLLQVGARGQTDANH